MFTLTSLHVGAVSERTSLVALALCVGVDESTAAGR
jgi:hypothetical protein